MWQLSALGSLIAQALEGVVDKAAMVRDGHIHPGVATFWRNALLLFYVTVVGSLGFFGEMELVFSWPIIAFGCMAALSGYFYTYVLKKVEITGAYIETYLAPIGFLAIDLFVLNTDLSPAQIVGVIVLTAGGFALAFNARTHHMKREFSLRIWGVFLYWLIYDGTQFYLFKYLYEKGEVNEVSFVASVWLIAVSVVFLYLAFTGKAHLLFAHAARRYVPVVAVSKIFDAASTLLWLHALSFVAVSQVAALNALSPLMLFLVALFVQKETRMNIRERVDKANISWKVVATTMLCLGTLLVT